MEIRRLENRSNLDRIFQNRPQEFGDVWQAVGQIGAAAAQTGLNQLFGAGGGAAGGPARGLAAINTFGQQVIQTLGQMLTAAQSGQVPVAQALTDAQAAAAALSNPQYVYQAQRGNDAAALNTFKTQAAAIVQQIQALAASAGDGTGSQTVTTVDPVTGRPVTTTIPASSASSGDGSVFGISPTLLMLGGGGLLLFLLLKK